MKVALGYLSSAGVPGRYMGKTACYATQLIYWEFITGLRSTSTLQLKKSSNNLSKYIKNAKNGSVTVSNIQKMYNSIDSKLKAYGEKAKGYKYSYDTKPEGYAKKTVNFATSMKDAKGCSKIEGKQISKKATYKYEYKMKLLYPSRYTDYKIVNGSGQKASGTNGKFTLSVSKGGYITIKSKKSIQEYKEAFYLTFKQNVSGSYKTFCINVKAFFMIRVALGFYFFERRSESASHFIKQCCAESITQISIIEVVDRTPESIITVTTFRYKTVDVGIPF